jgi:hypothetical protein
MRIKTSLFIAAIICFIVLMFGEQLLTSLQAPIKVNQPIQKIEPIEKQTTITENDLSIEESVKSKSLTLESHEASYVFDADPVIEAGLIIKNNENCYQQLSTHKNTIRYMKQAQLTFSSKQKSFFKSYKKYCQELNELHPEYNLTNINKIKYPNKKRVATSQWGNIVNGEIDVTTLGDYEIRNILKKNDVNILSQAPRYLKGYYQKVIHWDLEDVLQNHQYDYINYIQHLTHQLYLCELGADCSVTSSIMVRLCYRNSMNCGLDYPLFIQKTLSQGQQADIKLALEYFKIQYQ